MSMSRDAQEREEKYRNTAPLFCGNFEYDAPMREVERLFERYGPIERMDMKTGFAFVYMRDKRDADDAIHGLDGKEFGVRRRRLRVEWSKGDGEVKQRENRRRPRLQPTTSLFIVNFDVERTRERDIEDHFRAHGRLTRVQIKKNYAFVEYETVEEAKDALEACNGGRFAGRTLTVEYVSNEPASRAPETRHSPRRRSPSPGRRGSPRYGRSRDREDTRSRRRSRSFPRRRSLSRSRSPASLTPRRSLSRSPSRSISR